MTVGRWGWNVRDQVGGVMWGEYWEGQMEREGTFLGPIETWH